MPSTPSPAAPEPPPWVAPTWEQVVREHSARVRRHALRLTGNPHDADDLTQEVFVRVFRSLATFTPGTFEGWLHRITVNCFIDSVRRRSIVRIDPLDPAAGERLPDLRGGVEAEYDRTHLEPDIRAALAALTPDFRAVVVLADVEGRSSTEVGARLGIKPATVRTRLHRARAQLRALLPHLAPTGPRPGMGLV